MIGYLCDVFIVILFDKEWKNWFVKCWEFKKVLVITVIIGYVIGVGKYY